MNSGEVLGDLYACIGPHLSHYVISALKRITDIPVLDHHRIPQPAIVLADRFTQLDPVGFAFFVPDQPSHLTHFHVGAMADKFPLLVANIRECEPGLGAESCLRGY